MKVHLSFLIVLLSVLLTGCAVENAALLTLQGANQVELGHPEQAILRYDQAILLDPTVAEAYYGRGIAYDRMADFEKAIGEFDGAIALKADWAEAYRARGRAYRESGDLERALEDYNQALALQPEFVDAYIGRGYTFGMLEKNREAIADFTRAIELSPEEVEAYYGRGAISFKVGNYQKAIRDFDKLIELDPEDFVAYHYRGDCYANQHKYETAILDYDRVIELSPGNAEAYYSRGNAYFQIQFYDQAIEDLAKAIELLPEIAPAAYALQGYTYAALGDYEEAIIALDTAIELDAELADAYYLRGYIYYELGNVEQAIQNFESFLELDPNPTQREEVEATLAELTAPPLQPVGQPLIDLAELGERPLLHWDLTETEGEQQIVQAATTADGRKIGSYPYQGAVWSPSGEQFAFAAAGEWHESVFVMNLEGESQAIFTPESDEWLVTWHVAWSPDGERLAVIVGQTDEEASDATFGNIDFILVIVDVATQQTLSRHAIPEGTLMIPISMSPPNNFRWSPDGQKVLVSWENAVVIDLENERTVAISDQPVVAEWTPEGDGVYYLPIDGYDQPGPRSFGGFFVRKLDDDAAVQLMDASELAAQGLTINYAFHYGLLVLSPSASKLAFVGGAGEEGGSTLRIYDLKQGQPLALDQPAQTFVSETSLTMLEWSPDEESVAVVSFEQEGALAIKLLEVASARWHELVKLEIDWGDGGAIEWLAVFKIISWTL